MKAFPKETRAKDINAKAGDKFIVATDEDEVFSKGEVISLIEDDGSWCPYFEGVEFNHHMHWHDLAPYIRDLAHLQEGDVLMDKYNDERMVLGICGKVIFISSTGFDNYGSGWTAAELKNNGYTLKDATPATTELTVAEVAQKLGYKPGELRIKE